MSPVAADELQILIARQTDALVAMRHDLHRHPQLAFEETYASHRVQTELHKLGIDFEAGFAETGVVGWIEPTDGTARRRPAVALRADMDALPITEQTGLPYASENEGVMHACGHDGHITILLGAATALSSLREHLPQPVKLVFQPAEEGRGGAKVMMAADVLSEHVGGHRAERIFALHGWPWLEVGSVSCKPGPIMASMDEFAIDVKGSGGHGATPHRTADPLVAAAQIITAAQSIVSRNIDPTDSAVLSITTIHAGQAHNIIPDTAEMTGTIRALNDATGRLIHRRLRETVESIAHALGCEGRLDLRLGYPVTENDPDCAETVLEVAADVLGDDHAVRLERAIMVAEDFAFYGRGDGHSEERRGAAEAGVPAAFFFLGLRPRDWDQYPGLHTPKFDFNDAAIPVGMRMMCELALRPPHG